MDPDVFVAMDHLRIGTRTAIENMREVQLVPGAVGQQHRVAERVVHRVREDFRRKDGDCPATPVT